MMKKNYHSYRMIILLVIPLFLNGCSITPNKFKYNFSEIGQSLKLNKNIYVASVDMDADAPTNQVFMALNMGTFSDKDLQVINQSLTDTLEQYNLTENRENINLHLYFHKYILSFSNIQSSALVGVEWCLESKGSVIENELIYVAYGKGGNLSTLKDRINKTIVRYVANMAFSESIDNFQSEKISNVYKNLEGAVSVLPEKIGGTIFGVAGALAGGEVKEETVFSKITEIEPLDWNGYLGKFYSTSNLSKEHFHPK